MDHEELRVPDPPDPPAADVVEMELRCADWALSILGMLIIVMRKERNGDESEIGNRKNAATEGEQTV